MKNSIEINKNLIQAKLKKQKKVLATSQKTLNTLNKNIKGTKTQIELNKNQKKGLDKKQGDTQKDGDQIVEEQFQDSNLNQLSQLSQLQFEQIQLSQTQQSQTPNIFQSGENKFEQYLIKDKQENTDKYDIRDEESNTQSINSQNYNNQKQNDQENYFTLLKKL
ncbi:hypothetical protein ABPG72_003255 [Tetrahymena utriculariae]